MTPRPLTPSKSRRHFAQLSENLLELALEVGLQELEPEHLRLDGDRMIASTGSLRFVDELVGLDRLLGDGADGVLQDLALPLLHGQMPAQEDDGNTTSVGGVSRCSTGPERSQRDDSVES